MVVIRSRFSSQNSKFWSFRRKTRLALSYLLQYPFQEFWSVVFQEFEEALKINPGYQILAGHIVFLAILTFRPQGFFPKTR